MKKIYVAVTWEQCGYIPVNVEDNEGMLEAIQKVKEDSDNFSLPIENNYVDGSFVPSTEDVEEMKLITSHLNTL